MARRVHCDNFKEEQYVPARQVRTVLTVYIASREERSAAGGLGCAVKDLFGDSERRLKVSDLMRMKLTYPNGKPVRAYSLKGGNTYTFVGVPSQQNYGVFIVPKGNAYEYIYRGKELLPGSCLLTDGKNTKVIDYRLFRKLFVMSPNAVAMGHLKKSNPVAQNVSYQASQTPFSRFSSRVTPQVQQVQQQQYAPQAQTQYNSPQNSGVQKQAQQNTVQLQVVGRILRGTELLGLVLSDGSQQMQVPLSLCLKYAESGRIAHVKAVARGNSKFLSGVGISIEHLPSVQV